MAAKIYCLASPKGGSGKTIICSSMGTFLAEIGKKVLLIDADVATNGLTLLYLREVSEHKDHISSNKGEPNGLFDGKQFSIERDIISLSNNIDFIPATFHFKINEMNSNIILNIVLNDIIEKIKDNYDYIFLDAQAGADYYSRVAMSSKISDEVIIVTEYDPLSAAGVERLKAIMGDELIFTRTWTLINKMLPEFVDSFSDFLEVTKYLSPIPWDADVVRAYSRRTLPVDFINGNQFTLAIMQTLKGFLSPDLSSQIEAWAETKASNIRVPIQEQYRDAEREFMGLIESKRKLKRKGINIRLILATAVSLVFVAIAVADYIMNGVKPFNISGFPFYIEFLLIFMICFIFFSLLISSRFSDMIVEFASIFIKIPFGNLDSEITGYRLDRQIDILEEKLKRLEVMQKADLRTLIKEREKNIR